MRGQIGFEARYSTLDIATLPQQMTYECNSGQDHNASGSEGQSGSGWHLGNDTRLDLKQDDGNGKLICLSSRELCGIIHHFKEIKVFCMLRS